MHDAAKDRPVVLLAMRPVTTVPAGPNAVPCRTTVDPPAVTSGTAGLPWLTREGGAKALKKVDTALVCPPTVTCHT